MDGKIPKKIRRLEPSVTTNCSDQGKYTPKTITSKSNPLWVEGCFVFGQTDSSGTIMVSLERAVRENMECTSDPSSVHCAFQIGRLIGVAQNRNIVLPVENESILENDESKVKFIAEVSQKSIDTLYTDIFTSQDGSYRLVSDPDSLELEVVSSSKMDVRKGGDRYEGFHHTRVYRVPYSTEEGMRLSEMECWDHSNLNNVIVYRPQSTYHYRLQASTKISAPVKSNLAESEVVLKLAFRHARNYKTCKNGDKKLVKWKFHIYDQWDIVVNDEIAKMPLERLFGLLTACLINGIDETSCHFFEREVAEESRRQYLEASVDGSQLAKQFLRLSQCKDNRFGYIIAMVHSNLKMMLYHFDSIDMELDNMVDFYPNRFGGTSEAAQFHYDTRKLVRQKGSAIEALRRNNNLIKRIIIACHVRKKSAVLDLACGHCQDLDKYATVGVSHVLGIDISLAEIMEARRRFSYHRKGGRIRFNAEFHHGNILDEKVYSTYVRDKRFDVVSIQLAIHYMISDEASATMLLSNIHKALNDKGIFIGSTVCCKAIAKGLKANAPYHSSEKGGPVWDFGNSIFKVSMEESSIEKLTDGDITRELSFEMLSSKLESRWGLKYHFFLMETIDAGEYVVPWKSFTDLCTSVGFRLIETFSFPEYLERSEKVFSQMSLSLEPSVTENVLRHLKTMSSVIMSKEQQEAFTLYRLFVFEKVTGRDKMYMQGVKIRRV